VKILIDVGVIHIPARAKGLNIEMQEVYKKLVFHNHNFDILNI
jgi:hypothetical protein